MTRTHRPLLALLAAGVLLAAACTSSGSSAETRTAPTTTSTATEATTAAAATPSTSVPTFSLADRALLGAYYYLWNPENLAQGTLRASLVPPQLDAHHQAAAPDRGAERDIADAAAHGIDFFAVDWWPTRPASNRHLDELLAAPNIDDIRFCIFYELQDLNYDVETGTTKLGRREIATLTRDLDAIAGRYFTHPGYLRVDGRPVVVLYLTRTLVGDVAGAIRAARATVAAHGEDVLLIGDEVFWNVAPLGAGRARPTTKPQPERARLFDAITAYNLYDGGTRGRAGYGSTSSFLADSRRLFETYREATGGAVPIVPSVIPGFNDRGVRPRLRHPVIPRQWEPGGPEAGFLAHALDDVAIPLLDERLPIVLVTTWNEWNEDTAVEPVLDPASPPTARDQSRSGDALTGGFTYAPNGTAFVDVLQDRFGPPAGKERPWPRTR